MFTSLSLTPSALLILLALPAIVATEQKKDVWHYNNNLEYDVLTLLNRIHNGSLLRSELTDQNKVYLFNYLPTKKFLAQNLDNNIILHTDIRQEIAINPHNTLLNVRKKIAGVYSTLPNPNCPKYTDVQLYLHPEGDTDPQLLSRRLEHKTVKSVLGSSTSVLRYALGPCPTTHSDTNPQHKVKYSKNIKKPHSRLSKGLQNSQNNTRPKTSKRVGKQSINEKKTKASVQTIDVRLINREREGLLTFMAKVTNTKQQTIPNISIGVDHTLNHVRKQIALAYNNTISQNRIDFRHIALYAKTQDNPSLKKIKITNYDFDSRTIKSIDSGSLLLTTASLSYGIYHYATLGRLAK